MTLSEELTARNLIDNSTFADLSELDEPGKKWTVYLGLDASAPSQNYWQLSSSINS